MDDDSAIVDSYG